VNAKRERQRKRCFVLWVALASLAPPASGARQARAQGEIPDSFLVGEEVLVARTDGTLIRGRWTGMGATVAIRTDSRAIVFAARELAAIWRVRMERQTGKGALLGLALGAGFGLALAVSACEGDCDGGSYWLGFPLYLGSAGAGLGAGLGALDKADRFEAFPLGAFLGAQEAAARWEVYEAALRRRLETSQGEWLRIATTDGKAERYKIQRVDSSAVSVWRMSGGKDQYKAIPRQQLLGILED